MKKLSKVMILVGCMLGVHCAQGKTKKTDPFKAFVRASDDPELIKRYLKAPGKKQEKKPRHYSRKSRCPHRVRHRARRDKVK